MALAAIEPLAASRCRDEFRDKVKTAVDRHDDPGLGRSCGRVIRRRELTFRPLPAVSDCER